ncbi:MAG TPA: PhoD-like phosphatase N-terminal domain-containing protein, partial [Reyranella sp.]|nr:PhoD-like phosphatase N-terminal domain-containing protein [Reyranella sp.]
MLRRSFLLGAGGLVLPATARDHVFPLGVASGCPRPTSVVLWTRVTAPGLVAWAIAEDEGMRRV